MQEGRWTTITPSQFTHEREALAHVQALLPDTEPYRAWSNFTFTAQSGHPYEVDLLVAAPGGLYLIEIKSLNGRLTSSGSNWFLTNHGSTRVFDNPLHLADLKAKKLRSLLQVAAGQRKGPPIKIPFVQAAVFLSKPGLKVELAEHHLHAVYGPEPAPGHQPGVLPSIGSLLQRPPQDEKYRVTKEQSAALPNLLHAVGIARSRKHYQVGSWELDSRPFDLGPTWQDHHARHRELEREHRRIRIYLVERNAVQAERASIERAAKREMVALHNINHPGIVRVDSMESHEAGPALIFRHDPRSVRLDHYVAQYGDRLDALSRLAMIRQLSEAVAYAHRRRLYHRALSARSVLVTPGRKRKGGTEDEAWLTPQLQISDWQAATRAADTAGGSSGDPLTLSTHAASHIERSAEAYLAPELTAPRPDPVAMDVFGLGALAYLILTGQPPAAKRQELLTRIARDNGLRASVVADGVSEFADELIQAASAPIPAQRLTTVADFVEMLEEVENELTAPPPASVHPQEPEPEVDPLEARGGDRVGEWIVKRRLGTGSTCRAFLAHNERTGKDEVLKVGLSDEKGARLAHEARVLAPLTDSRVIRLARPEPLQIGNRTVVVLEHAGELTLARKLRDDGRLTVDELETYSDYLFGALDYLEGEGVYHRDVKPDNIAIRVRPNRTRQLVLFDFSLAGVSVKEISAGTQRYLDPFLGSANRPNYDKHAEWYALAVTLHEMASGELPVWGDGGTEPQLTEGPPVLAVEAFDPAIRDGLVEFFDLALHRDHRRRFASLKDMRDAWQQVFRRSDASAPVGSDHPEIADDEPDEKAAEAARDDAAGKSTRATVLEAAGLTLRAVSAAHRLEATTVGELLAVANKLAHLPGLGARTRQELQRRVKEWRTRLGERETIPTSAAARKEATAEAATETAADTGQADLVRVGLDAIATLLVPAKNGRNAAEVEATRLLLSLPDESGALPPLQLWPQQPQVAAAVGVTPGRIAQILGKQRKRWHGLPVVGSVRTQIIELLRDGGRVMGVAELATALLTSRGSVRTGDELRMAVAVAAVRSAVEVDALAEEPRLLLRRHARADIDGKPHPRGDRLLVALEAGEDDAPDTPAAPALLDYADALGKAADKLAGSEVLPSPATVLRTLATVIAPGGAADAIDERRRVLLAAVASERAAATARLELYPRDLDPVRALRLAQAGVVPPASTPEGRRGLAPEQIAQRVAARFPELAPLPPHPKLDRLLADAGFDLRWGRDRYVPPPPRAGSSSMSILQRRPSATTAPSRWTAESPELAAAMRAEERLTGARSAGGFRALTVRLSRYPYAREELVRRFDARPVNVASVFLRELHALVDARPKPTWETVLGADIAEPGSRAAIKLGEYVEQAWELAVPALRASLSPGGGPVLLHDAAVLARYRAMERLYELADAARGGAGDVWLLCPMEDPALLPKLDGAVVRVGDNEWIALPDAWVVNAHRSALPA
ncbi:BREX system serine/threonine kinase PglW [Micromonospora sp. WMMC415]|uniref:BREX system serine/threonine kinase PglW n=1 Tax=Micromonospora sp. WMMC415 TaxID=2675222 RepID=UPI0012B4DFCF|nr:BREX system serine/threonine kinase PglW [Micromonospora sp. WMMC415]QGN48429.1 BREX system serine/threonine kinase PglW [Micromonospora sp. WMMC415]